jgi:hypothetical protein
VAREEASSVTEHRQAILVLVIIAAEESLARSKITTASSSGTGRRFFFLLGDHSALSIYLMKNNKQEISEKAYGAFYYGMSFATGSVISTIDVYRVSPSPVPSFLKIAIAGVSCTIVKLV